MRLMPITRISLISVLAMQVPMHAQSIVVPQALETVRGQTGNNVNTNPMPTTYMAGIPASELSRLPRGALVYGVSFRAGVQTSNPATWPAGDASWTSYEVTIGYALPLTSWTGTFATNWINTPFPPVQVRSGPMVMDSGTFTNNTSLPGTQPNAFCDFFWDFHRPFIYLGGDLGMLFEHTGMPAQVPLFIDRSLTNPATGIGFYTFAYQATSGTTNNFLVTRIHYGYGTGCPGTASKTPVLVQSNDVTGGGSVTFGIGNGPASAPAIYVVGARQATINLSNGCVLLATPTILVPVALSAKGRHALQASFLAGLSLLAYVQAFVIDAGAPGGFSATNGVTLTVNP